MLLGVATIVTSQLRQPAATNTNQVQTNSTNVGSSLNNRETFQRFPAVVIEDKDNDGLSDADEQRNGTNAELSDTDGDGLTDKEEVEVYKSDPLRQDSDGDGHHDKAEVDTGNNPNGPGLLRDVSQAIQQLEQ